MGSDFVRDTLAAYDAWAATYDTIDNPLIALASAVLDERAGLAAGARVVELGCGTGRNARWALGAGASLYVGIDGSAAMLERARATISDERAAFVEAELGRVSLGGDGRFDLALVCLVLEHLADVGPVLAAAARALAPGGRLLVLELAPSLHARGVGANFRDGDGSERRLPSFRHDADELLAAARAAGFIDAAARTHAPTAAALARSAKLARYLGEAVLLELAARR
jgi:ubiquinone/menaquinone biosynthesis C-methylase UbiE